MMIGRVVLETEDYQPVGVFEDEKIVFEDNLQVANHFQRVRESTIPEDPDRSTRTINLEDNYKELKLIYTMRNAFYNTIQVFGI